MNEYTFPSEQEVLAKYAALIERHPHEMMRFFAEARCQTCSYNLHLAGKVSGGYGNASVTIAFQQVFETQSY